MNAELELKLTQVRALIKEQKAAGALFGLQPNFSWLACGGEAHIPLNTDRAFGQLLVTPKELYVFATRIEMPRLTNEALKGLGAKPLVYEWFDNLGALETLKSVVDPKKVISDNGDWGTQARPELFAPLHYSLQPVEVKRYLALGKATEAAMNETCRAIEPGQDEFSLAGQLADACWQRDLTPIVLLVATDERVKNFRHPLPTKKKLKKYAMLVLCARQHGLIVAMTRLVHFGKLSEDLKRRHQSVCLVDTALHESTRIGTPVREVFRRGTAAYAERGFPDEWHLHHQGGPCGYQGRDYLGSPTAPGVVLENQPFAWNPSITGTKSEDTILATAKGPIVVTESHDWPQIAVEWDGKIVKRPDILVR